MRRLWALLLVAILMVSAFPLAGQAHLVCRISGQEMQPIAAEKDPTSCCAVERTASGELMLANRSCCEIKTTPSHAPIPGNLAPDSVAGAATLTTLTRAVPIPAYLQIAPPVAFESTPLFRGPPPSPASPRAPPTLS